MAYLHIRQLWNIDLAWLLDNDLDEDSSLFSHNAYLGSDLCQACRWSIQNTYLTGR